MSVTVHKKQLSNEIRTSIVRKYNSGKSITTISEELEINYQTVSSIVRLFNSTGRILAVKKRNIVRKKLTIIETDYIKELIENDASITLDAIKQKLETEKNVFVSRSTIDREIKDFNFSFKKVQLIPESRNTVENLEKRFVYASEFLQIDEDKVVFLDEFGASCSIRSNYGRSQIGTTPRKTVRAIRTKNYSISAAVSKDRLLYYEVKNESYNGERYLNFIEDFLNIMRSQNLNDMILIMDNLPVHKMQPIKNIVEQNGHILRFLPPYSPQLNPIEEVFSKWKNTIKNLNPNNFQELEAAIENGYNSISCDDCRAYFRHMRQFTVKGLTREEF